MSESEYTNDPEALIEQAKEHKQEAEARHRGMLEAVAEGEGEWLTQETEQREFGGVELDLRTWLDGDSLDDLAYLEEAIGEEVPGAARDALQIEIDLFTRQTEAVVAPNDTFTSEADIRQFWRGIKSEYGDKGLEQAQELVMDVVDTEQKRREGVVSSFPESQGRSSLRGTRARRPQAQRDS